MRINHNISALNASNSLKSNNNAISRNLQKLSSGYRINSAADDAAGLAVSEKMRAQINGLSQAQDNAQNGISLVQTAEGGLNETESILQRMNTLAVESANGTYDSSTDRSNLNKEITALKSEVDRISTSTNFNGINLLDGSLSTPTVSVSKAVDGDALKINASTKGAFSFGAVAGFSSLCTTGGGAAYDTMTVTYQDEQGTLHTATATLTLDTLGSAGNTIGKVKGASGNTYTDSGKVDGFSTISLGNAFQAEFAHDDTFNKQFDISVDSSTGQLTFTAKTTGTKGAKVVTATEDSSIGNGASITRSTHTVVQTSGSGANDTPTLNVAKLKSFDGTNAADAVFTVNGQKFAFTDSTAHGAQLGADVNFVIATSLNNAAAKDMSNLINQKTGMSTAVDVSLTTNINFVSQGQSVSFQIGSDNKADQRVSLSVGDMSSKGLGIQNISVATQTDAQSAIDTIKAAVNQVSASRADLGALQNRLEHTTNNLSTMNQNLTSAESTIRDVDMSSEMVDLTKNQILQQAATSMLAQANSLPQSVLSLLKG